MIIKYIRNKYMIITLLTENIMCNCTHTPNRNQLHARTKTKVNCTHAPVTIKINYMHGPKPKAIARAH